MNETRSRLVTHNHVLSELVALVLARRFLRQPALDFIEFLIEEPLVEIIWTDRALHEQAMQLLRQRLDKGYSLCDAMSFIVMRQRGISTALTTDRHFEQEGFIKML